MTELTREQIERVRVLAKDHTGAEYTLFSVSVRALCDMALRTHDAEQRAERAESLVAELLPYTHSDGRTPADLKIRAREALATPPEGGTCNECHGTGEVCAGGNPADSGTWHPCPACDGYGTGSQQPEDALSYFDEVMADFHELTGIDPNANPKVRGVRHALTVSAVPEGWKWQTSRDMTDEYITSLIAPDGTTVYVGEDDKAIAWLESLLSTASTKAPCPHVRTSDGGTSYCTLAESGSAGPYVPDEVRRLVGDWRIRAKHGRAIWPTVPNEAIKIGVLDGCAEELERAISAAPTKGGHSNG